MSLVYLPQSDIYLILCNDQVIVGDSDLRLGMPCGQNLFKRSVVSVFLKEREPHDTAI